MGRGRRRIGILIVGMRGRKGRSSIDIILVRLLGVKIRLILWLLAEVLRVLV